MIAAFWILWNHDSEKPPTQRFQNEADAIRVAKAMSEKFGGTVYVMRAIGVAYTDLSTGLDEAPLTFYQQASRR